MKEDLLELKDIWVRTKDKFPDDLLFYETNDGYILFYADAIFVSNLLNIPLNDENEFLYLELKKHHVEQYENENLLMKCGKRLIISRII